MEEVRKEFHQSLAALRCLGVRGAERGLGAGLRVAVGERGIDGHLALGTGLTLRAQGAEPGGHGLLPGHPGGVHLGREYLVDAADPAGAMHVVGVQARARDGNAVRGVHHALAPHLACPARAALRRVAHNPSEARSARWIKPPHARRTCS